MIEHSLLLKLSSPEITDRSTSRLRQEYQACQRLFEGQPTLVQQYLNTQATFLSEAIVQRSSRAQFTLPATVMCASLPDGFLREEIVPANQRKQTLGNRLDWLAHIDLVPSLNQRLSELERSSNQSVSLSAGLLRYAISIHMVYNILPTGRSVDYSVGEGNDIPNQPAMREIAIASASKSGIATQPLASQMHLDQGELSVPYTEAARRFYLPQWIAFDDDGKLLLTSLREAEAQIASMQQYLSILQSAIVIAPYMIADDVWQQKRYGMLGQLVNQGRALADYQLHEIVQVIQRRVSEHRLDRGLSLSLPYFNDQTLKMEVYNFDVIPAGRVMFVPAFVVLAVRAQAVKVAQDTSLSQSTRRHLLVELSTLEEKFLR